MTTYRSPPLKYKKGYKYVVDETHKEFIPALRAHSAKVTCSKAGTLLELKEGHLTIHKGYAWDGPSGPTWDTSTFMKGSCVHDALYQLMREGKVPKTIRLIADQTMRRLNLRAGMLGARAWYTFKAVRKFGRRAAEKPKKVYTAP